MESVDGQRASQLVTAHGKRAMQMLVDEIVVAVRNSDDATVAALDRQLRHAERLTEKLGLLRVPRA